ncbi:MAG: peptidase T [Bacteroidota bacterium]
MRKEINNLHFTVKDRFLKYVQIDTQSDPHSGSSPSTEKQKDLAKVLVAELLELGVSDAYMDEFGLVYATVPSTTTKEVPVICFCSHMDTSPDSSGTGVKPIVHENYDGKDIILPDDPRQVLKPSEHPDLHKQIGNQVITASGTTLLGADNKSGVAAIMDAVHHWMKNPDQAHGEIKILFTTDEEIGRGADEVDLEKLGAKYGYTVDGEAAGTLEDETFSADGASILIDGVSAHPGFAKGKLESAIKIAADIVSRLPRPLSPEKTEGKEGFIHPVEIKGNVEQAQIDFILRDFRNEKLTTYADLLQKIIDEVAPSYPNSQIKLEVKEQYRNMKYVLDDHPEVIAFAEEAIKRTGLAAVKRSIRGGTDGSRFSYMGLPCPNIFAGEHAFHSKLEWVSVEDMQKSVETIIHLASIWEEKA